MHPVCSSKVWRNVMLTTYQAGGLDVHFVSPTPVHSPSGVGTQRAAPLQRPYGYWQGIYETDI